MCSLPHRVGGTRMQGARLTCPIWPAAVRRYASRIQPSAICVMACCRTFCTLDFHPKDAEELVTEVSKTFQLAPNATTLRTLDKIWAAHDQMYG